MSKLIENSMLNGGIPIGNITNIGMKQKLERERKLILVSIYSGHRIIGWSHRIIGWRLVSAVKIGDKYKVIPEAVCKPSN